MFVAGESSEGGMSGTWSVAGPGSVGAKRERIHPSVRGVDDVAGSGDVHERGGANPR